MTPDAKEPILGALPDEQDSQEVPRVLTYEPPALVALGNVHALLAGTSASLTFDSNKITMRSGG